MWTALVVGAPAALIEAKPDTHESKCGVLQGATRRTTVEQVAAHPDRWDCRRIRVVGVAVRGFEDYNLYATPNERCADRPKAIAVDWYKSSVMEKRFARMAEIEGTFRDVYGRKLPNDEIMIENSAAGPGPLSDVRVVRWLSTDIANCKHR